MPTGNKEISALKSVTFIGTAISRAKNLQTWLLSKLIQNSSTQPRVEREQASACLVEMIPMKKELVALLIALTVSIGAAVAQSTFQIAEVDQILANPEKYQGHIIALHGIVGSVATEKKTFTVLNSKSNTTGETKFVRVSLPEKSQIVMPAPQQEVVVTGQIEKRVGGMSFLPTQVFTNRADIQQLLTQGAIVRPPGKRPGDNLGRDAHQIDDSQ